MYSIEACQVCGEAKRTVVSEYNRLIFMDSMWQSDLARFEYALCHGCGLVYATRRPDRAEYDFLYENFNEFLMRRADPNSLSTPELAPDRAAEIDAQFVPWYELRSAIGRGPTNKKGKIRMDAIRKILSRDLENALIYLPYITQHVPLEGAKVLHVRAKASTLVDLMKKTLGAVQADVMTLFPAYAYLAEKNAGVRAKTCLDYEDFYIPFDEKYNLIIENHILIHMMDPNKTFGVFTSHLEPDGSLFMYNELDDAQLFKNRKNLFAELRPFHYHQFDVPTAERIFRRYGFDIAFLSSKGEESPALFGVAKLKHKHVSCPRISAAELHARLDMYARWRDESILSLPKERCHALFGHELPQIWKRVRTSGALKRNWRGLPSALRRFSEAGVPPEQLEIGSAIAKLRRSVSERTVNWLASRLARTPFAAGLAPRLRGTRTGNWLIARMNGRRLADR